MRLIDRPGNILLSWTGCLGWKCCRRLHRSLPPLREKWGYEVLRLVQLELPAGLLLGLGFVVSKRASLCSVDQSPFVTKPPWARSHWNWWWNSHVHCRWSKSWVHKKCTTCMRYANEVGENNGLKSAMYQWKSSPRMVRYSTTLLCFPPFTLTH